MKTPFQALATSGPILFAANGPNIISFSITCSRHLSSWQYPKARKDDLPQAAVTEENDGFDGDINSVDSPASKEEGVDDGPPAKRRKVADSIEQGPAGELLEQNGGDGQDVPVNGSEEAMPLASEGKQEEEKGRGGGDGRQWPPVQAKENDDINEEPATTKDGTRRGKKQKRRGRPNTEEAPKQVVELPMVQCMSVTTDGKHVVAVTSTDKTIWVFEHDGEGKLTELSHRQMPKRPSAIVISRDNKTVLSADKFGDVYALPLIQTSENESKEPTPKPLSRSSTPATPQPFKYQANALTVHTKRNLKALENQRKQAEMQAGVSEKKDPQADFEHTLLLGHVSMLTDIKLASSNGKDYIMTADRDEHIRISRGMPQSHIIENYCLGHTDFVSRLHIPQSLGNILISGGGDSHLFLWDWVKGELITKLNIREAVEKAAEGDTELPKFSIPHDIAIAVSGLTSYHDESLGQTRIWVTCESIPYILSFSLCDEGLSSPLVKENIGYQVTGLRLPGNPLGLVTFRSRDGLPNTQGVIVSYDTTSCQQGTSVEIVKVDELRRLIRHKMSFVDEHVDEVPESLLQDLKRALYNTEPLRKDSYEREGSRKEDI